MKVICKLLLILLLQLCRSLDYCDPRVFNWRFYLCHNRDFISAVTREPIPACNHWKIYGIKVGRQAHTTFHSRQYCDVNPELSAQGLCNNNEFDKVVEHYLTEGYYKPKVPYSTDGRHGTWTIANNVLALLVSKDNGGAISSIMHKGTTEVINAYHRTHNLQVYMGVPHAVNDTILIEGGVEEDPHHGTGTTNFIGAQVTGNSQINTEAELYYYYSKIKSQFTLKKTIKINVNNNPNLISCEVSFVTPRELTYLALYDTRVFIHKDFNKIYQIDLDSFTYHEVTFPAIGKCDGVSTKPIMYATSSDLAIGISIKSIEGPKGLQHYLYCGKSYEYDDIQEPTVFESLYYVIESIPQGTIIKVMSYIAVGTKEEVFEALTTP